MSDSSLVATAVTPTARDLTDARAVALDALRASSSATMGDLENALHAARGVRPADRNERVRVQGHSHVNAQHIDEESPLIVQKRLHFALREALSALRAEGVIVTADGDIYGKAEDSVAAEGDNWQGSVQFRHDYSPAPQGRIKLNQSSSHRLELANATFVTDIAHLLGQRGTEVLHEAIRCYHRGLFLAGVDLLAAASESAWFVLASLIKTDARLSQHVSAGTNAAEVINRAFEAISRAGVVDRHALNDVRAQAARFRDLRNYGVHPIGIPDLDREPAFTEAGCAVLFMSAPRYFRQLNAIHTGLSAEALD